MGGRCVCLGEGDEMARKEYGKGRRRPGFKSQLCSLLGNLDESLLSLSPSFLFCHSKK